MLGQPASNEPGPRSRPHRTSLRLPEFDYSTPGAYFITICTFRKACLLGHVVENRASLNAAGSMVASMWAELPHHYPAVQTDAFVIMPNHVHGILILTDGHPDIHPPEDGQAWEPAPTIGLSDIVHRFKSLTTRRFAPLEHDSARGPVRRHLWQRNFYEHVIRDDDSLQRIREYVVNNPLSWSLDRENPNAASLSTSVKPTDLCRL